MRPKRHFFVDTLKEMRQKALHSHSMAIKDIFALLSGRGYAALLVLFAFPACLPLQIPGMSMPLGILLGFLGLRLMFAKQLWWPQWILKKQVPCLNVLKVVDHLIAFFENKHMRFLKPRLLVLFKPFFHRLNGLLIFLLAAFLALPLPLPLTNMLSAFPILALGLGLLEDDGLFILIGYGLFLISAIIIGALFVLGAAHISLFTSFVTDIFT